MKYTNKHNLPQPFVDLVTQDRYDNGGSDFTTTGLLKPPRVVALEKKHWNDLESDVSELVWRMSGQAKHYVLEMMAKKSPDRHIAEQRFFLHLSGVKISGQIDLFDKKEKVLYDWKETSVWKGILGDQIDWTRQGNINRFLLSKSGVEVEAIKNIAFFKDWKRNEAKNDASYPQCPIQIFNLDVWPLEQTEKFIRERIAMHQAAKVTLPECSPEDRWQKQDAWAVMKQGRKSAVKVHYEKPLAELHLQACDKRHSIEFRPGKSVRCEAYCPCLKFCAQGQKLVEAGKSEEPEAAQEAF